MTIDEATERLNRRAEIILQSHPGQDITDINLGIEALKWRKEAEENRRRLGYLDPLPGEI